MKRDECISETLKHINNVRQFLNDIIKNLLLRGIHHDESKLKDPELNVFCKFTPKLAGSTFGSEKYKKFLADMKPALDHHFEENRHHPEYHAMKHCLECQGLKGLHEMNLVDIIEMLCDWKAASMRHNDGDILKSIEINQKRFYYSNELKEIMISTVRDLGWDENKEATNGK